MTLNSIPDTRAVGGKNPGGLTGQRPSVEGMADPSDTDATVSEAPDTGSAATADETADADVVPSAADTGPGSRSGAGDPPDGTDLEAYTTDQRTLSPRVRVQWGARVLVATLVLGLVLSAAASRLNADPRLGGVAAIAAGLVGLVWVAFRYRVWAYEVRTDALYLQRGVVTHTRTLAPYVRIQHVDTSRGPLERGLGLSTLVVYTAGSRGADVSVPGLTPEEATDLQRRLKELAIEAEGGDAL
jgi:membrane protein YdbS with pleckstrin-like domain